MESKYKLKENDIKNLTCELEIEILTLILVVFY